MLPNVAGVRSTKNQILAYSIVVAIVGLLPVAMGFGGWIYGGSALVLGALFVWYAWALHQARDEDMTPARKLFFFSLVHLATLFAVLFVQAIVWRIWEVAI